MADYFNSAVDGAKKCFDVAAAKTGEAIEISKLYFDKSQVKSRINALYSRLGKASYAARSGNAEESALIEKICGQLDSAFAEMVSIEESINNAKSVKCAVCGKKNSAKSDYCKDCGTPLHDYEPDDTCYETEVK